MDNIEMRIRYIEAYRQQLRRETEEMGYGRPQANTNSAVHNSRKNMTAALPIIATAMLALSLVLALI